MFARTARLLLRPGWAEDAPALHAAIADEAVVRNLGRAPWPYALSDAESFLKLPPEGALPRLLVTLPGERARVIGGVGLHVEDGTPKLGYWLARDCWGRGYATEAAGAVIGMARGLGIGRIGAGHHVDNAASARVLAKLGFRPVGRVAARYSRARGRLVPTVLLALDLDEGPCAIAA